MVGRIPHRVEDFKKLVVTREIQSEESTRIVCRRSCENDNENDRDEEQIVERTRPYKSNGQLAREDSIVPPSLNSGNLVRQRKNFFQPEEN